MILVSVCQWIASLAAADAPPVAPNSVWDLVLKGGPVMIPIGLCSLVALTITVERLISLRRSTISPRELPSTLGQLLRVDAHNIPEALAACQRDGSPLAHILAAAIKRLHQPLELIERHVQEAGEREVFALRKRLRLLSVIASIAPLLGLLGTITGMITAFQTVAASAEALGRTELLATGIYEAMVTTAGGLIVAIPTLLAYHWISSRVDHLVAEMDAVTVDFIETHTVPVMAPTTPRTVSRRAESSVGANAPGDGRLPLAPTTA